MESSPPSQEQQAATPPTDRLDDEARTPTWLTVTGVGLFALAGIGWLITRPPQPTIEQMRASDPVLQVAPTVTSTSTSSAAAQASAPKPLASGLPRIKQPVRVLKP